jgi:protein-disulfide isomerase
MKRFIEINVLCLSVLILSPSAGAQRSGATKDGTANRADSSTPANGAQRSSATGKVPEVMSKDQGDAMLRELRQIRRLLEKQQAQLAVLLSPPSADPPPPESVQMSVHTDWNSIGRIDAPVTVVEFTDYECPFCKQFHLGVFSDLKSEYIDTGKVRWVSHDLPLDIHPYAMKAAQAARCAGEQNQFWELRDALLSTDAAPEDKIISGTAERLPLDMENFQKCLDSETFKTEVRRDAAEAAALQIGNTPTFVVAKSAPDKLDGVRIVGAQSLATFRSTIDALLSH